VSGSTIPQAGIQSHFSGILVSRARVRQLSSMHGQNAKPQMAGPRAVHSEASFLLEAGLTELPQDLLKLVVD
jgi:hypothetical protein